MGLVTGSIAMTIKEAAVPEQQKPSEYDAIVPADKMPPCPICGKPIVAGSDPYQVRDRVMLFIAHGMAALGHDGCRVAVAVEKK